MNEDFYLTIHSDQSTFKGTENETGCFRVYLGHELLLPGKWEVGLAEIFYPMTIRIMSREEAMIFVEYINPANDEVTEIKLIKLEKDEKGMVAMDNANFFQLLRDALSVHSIESWLEDKARIYLAADHKSRKLIFSEKMRIALGLMENSFVLVPALYGPYGLNVKRLLPQQLFVSTDIIHHQMVGGSYDKTLRCVNVDSEKYSYGCSGHERYETIHYYPLNHEKVDDIEIYIRDRFGKCVSFESGTLTVILHFRKVRDV
jgi:hypothetical protein